MTVKLRYLPRYTTRCKKDRNNENKNHPYWIMAHRLGDAA